MVCLRLPNISFRFVWTFVDFHCFSIISMNEFSQFFIELRRFRGQKVWRPVAACGGLWRPVAPDWNPFNNLYSMLAGWRLLQIDDLVTS